MVPPLTVLTRAPLEMSASRSLRIEGEGEEEEGGGVVVLVVSPAAIWRLLATSGSSGGLITTASASLTRCRSLVEK